MKIPGKKFLTLTSLWVLFSSAGAMAAGNLLEDGGFEDPVIAPDSTRLFTETETIAGAWDVIDNDVNLVGSLWQAAEGDQSLALNVEREGTIRQDIATIPKAIYRLSFALAGDPFVDQKMRLLSLKTLRVQAGSTVQSYAFDTAGHTTDDMGWVRKGFQFTAVDTTTPIVFESTTPGAFGPAIDDVIVTLRCPFPRITDVNDPNYDLECLR